MAKKAYLVTAEFTTRIIIDEEDVNNDEVIAGLAGMNYMEKIRNNEVLENITEIVEDEECPYGTLEKDTL